MNRHSLKRYPRNIRLEDMVFSKEILAYIYAKKILEFYDEANELIPSKSNKFITGKKINFFHPRNTYKLTSLEIKEIRELYKTGDYTQAQIADAYNVTQATISYHLKSIK